MNIKPLTKDEFLDLFPEFHETTTDRQRNNNTWQITADNHTSIKGTVDWLTYSDGTVPEPKFRLIPVSKALKEHIWEVFPKYSRDSWNSMILGYIAENPPAWLRRATNQ